MPQRCQCIPQFLHHKPQCSELGLRQRFPVLIPDFQVQADRSLESRKRIHAN